MTIRAGFLSCIVVIGLLQVGARAESSEEASSARATKEIVLEFNRLTNAMLAKGSTAADVDRLYALYTEDFEYVHPKYGGLYSRELLYGNTIRNLEAGRYDGSYQQEITNTIIGLDAAVIEWVIPGDDEAGKHMTLIELENGKISRIKEYW